MVDGYKWIFQTYMVHTQTKYNRSEKKTNNIIMKTIDNIIYILYYKSIFDVIFAAS